MGETNSSINDQKFMLDSYIWLSNPNNVKKMPLDKIGQMINFKDSRKDVNPLWNKNMYSNLPKTYGNLQGLDPVNRDDCLYARDIIIFADPNNIKESKLNTAFNVEKILHYDDFISDNNQQYQFTNQESQIINDMNNLLNSQPGLTQAVKDHIKANINSLVGRKLF